ncbi:CYTH-like domain-containing protein [Xylariomycetidae sp. FL2044]|nr:CYTH-like domain-containing protein [Xylariomycetidae sp. FL2044]
MDLRGMLNNDGGGAGGGSGGNRNNSDRDRASSSSTPTTSTSTSKLPPAPAPAQPATPAPATPIQSGPPPHSFRDYTHPQHASPGLPSHDYPPSAHPNHHTPSAAPTYVSPTSFHPPANPFPGRPPVPPLQATSTLDPRSPGSGSISGPSPYRQTPTSSVSAASGSYFPPTQQQQQQQHQHHHHQQQQQLQQQQQQQQQQPPPASPSQRHSYGPPHPYARDGYSAHQQAPPHPAYVQGQPPQQPVPQTPPVGTPGGSHHYLQSRSLSIQSTPTPTSAVSQHPPPFGSQYGLGSPVATAHHSSHFDQYPSQRQSSQPPTPLGPPISGAPRQSPVTSFQQPPSPYQQRIPLATASYPPHAIHASPPPPAPASIQRMSSGSQGVYDAVAESHRRSQSQQSRSERERSLSVSPKTRVPSLPSSTGQPPAPVSGDPELHHPPPHSQLPPKSAVNMDSQQSQAATTMPGKRKLDERDLQPDELENHRQPPPPPKLNGNHAQPPPQAVSRASASPLMPRRRRVPRSAPPVWAQCGRGRPLVASRNFSIKHPNATAPATGGQANGNQNDAGGSVKSEHASRHASPETTKPSGPVKAEDDGSEIARFNGRPFLWEPSLEKSKPMEVPSRALADFLVFNVVNSPSLEEVQARGVQFEIEAKLGTIIDKDTNDRIHFPIRAGECILADDARVAFRSSMTEKQHRHFNDYLNEQVKASHPNNPSAASRVPILYVHRREIDRFFELPQQMRQRLPTCVAGRLPPGSPLKARVTYDQKTGNVLAKIVKARVADLHIHMPHMPLDCRISINLEWDWDGPVEEIHDNQMPNRDRQPARNKDRLSYTHGVYQVDLTQVTQSQSPAQGGQTKDHELEIELDSKSLLEHGRLLMTQEPSRYADLVDGLLDNVRMLARQCPPAY